MSILISTLITVGLIALSQGSMYLFFSFVSWDILWISEVPNVGSEVRLGGAFLWVIMSAPTVLLSVIAGGAVYDYLGEMS